MRDVADSATTTISLHPGLRTGPRPATGQGLTAPVGTAIADTFLFGFDLREGLFMGQVFQPADHTGLPPGVTYAPQQISYLSASPVLICDTRHYADYIALSTAIGDFHGDFGGSIGGSYVNVIPSYRFAEKVYGYCFGGALVFTAARHRPSSQQALDADFKAALLALDGPGVSQTDFDRFFLTYGTHYLASGAFGNEYIFFSETSRNYAESGNDAEMSLQIGRIFDDVVASGKLDIDAALRSPSISSKFKCNTRFSIRTNGGDRAATDIEAFRRSADAAPALVLNPAASRTLTGGETAFTTFAPLCDLLADLTPDFRQAYATAVYTYYGLARNLVGPPILVAKDTTVASKTDFMFTATGHAVRVGDSAGLMTGPAEGDEGRPRASVDLVQVRRPAETGAIITAAVSNTVPVHRTEQAIMRVTTPFTAEQAPPVWAWQSPLNFPPTVMLGRSLDIGRLYIPDQGAETITFTAPTDGFLTGILTGISDGSRSILLVTDSQGQVRAACSQHWSSEADLAVKSATLCLPLRRGESYTIATLSSALTSTAALVFQPIYRDGTQPVAMIDAPVPLLPRRLIKPGQPGFVVAMLDASTGLAPQGATVQSSSFIYQGPAALKVANGDTANLKWQACTSACASARDDVWLPYGSAMAPIVISQPLFITNRQDPAMPDSTIATPVIDFYGIATDAH